MDALDSSDEEDGLQHRNSVIDRATRRNFKCIRLLRRHGYQWYPVMSCLQPSMTPSTGASASSLSMQSRRTSIMNIAWPPTRPGTTGRHTCLGTTGRRRARCAAIAIYHGHGLRAGVLLQPHLRELLACFPSRSSLHTCHSVFVCCDVPHDEDVATQGQASDHSFLLTEMSLPRRLLSARSTSAVTARTAAIAASHTTWCELFLLHVCCDASLLGITCAHGRNCSDHTLEDAASRALEGHACSQVLPVI